MARPIVVSQTGTGSTRVVQVDHHLNPFRIGFGVIVTGTVNYTVQYTYDDPQQPGVTLNWFDHGVVATSTANQDGYFEYPLQAIRLTVNSGTGTATMTIIQSGIHS